jgi:putative RNA 2'-phosphotransferase
MPKRNHQFKVEDLSRLLVYVLGRRPYEFGLIPEWNGFVSYKELLQALHEEPGWGYVRRSHINEVLLGKDRTLFESEEKGIRVLEKKWQLDLNTPSESPPKILFTPVRRKAHPVVMERGLRATEGRHLVLCQDRDMALRIGKRRDHEPVLLEIPARAAQGEGFLFYPFGNLHLTPQIPPRFIAGPPVSKEVLETRKVADIKTEKRKEKRHVIPAGSFPLDISRDPDPYRRAKGKKRKGWKEEARKTRRRKERGRDS